MRRPSRPARLQRPGAPPPPWRVVLLLLSPLPLPVSVSRSPRVAPFCGFSGAAGPSTSTCHRPPGVPRCRRRRCAGRPVADPLIAVGRCIGRWGRRCRIVGGRTGRDGAETQSEYGRESEFALHVQFSWERGPRVRDWLHIAYQCGADGEGNAGRGCWRHGLGDERALCSPRKIYLRWLVKISRSGRECRPGDPAVASRWVIAPAVALHGKLAAHAASPARRRAWAPQPDAAMAHQPDCGRIEASQRSVQLARISYTLRSGFGHGRF